MCVCLSFCTGLGPLVSAVCFVLLLSVLSTCSCGANFNLQYIQISLDAMKLISHLYEYNITLLLSGKFNQISSEGSSGFKLWEESGIFHQDPGFEQKFQIPCHAISLFKQSPLKAGQCQG